MPVNPVIRSADTWDNAEDPLVRQIQSSLFVPVLEPDDAAAEKAQPLSRWPRGEAEVEELLRRGEMEHVTAGAADGIPLLAQAE
jgi:hypothetical protein